MARKSRPDLEQHVPTEHHILVVDDSAITRALIRRVIEMTGLPVKAIREAPDGAAALDILLRLVNSDPLDLVFTDLNMPGIDGIELVRRIRQHSVFDRLPILVVSAQPDENCLRGLERNFVQGWLAKPFTPEGVRDLMERALGLHATIGGAP